MYVKMQRARSARAFGEMFLLCVLISGCGGGDASNPADSGQPLLDVQSQVDVQSPDQIAAPDTTTADIAVGQDAPTSDSTTTSGLTISDYVPKCGHAGTPVYVYGSGLTAVTDVCFGLNCFPSGTDKPALLETFAPPGTVESSDITVVTTAGAIPVGFFTYNAAPAQVSHVTPSPAPEGAEVELKGLYLEQVDGVFFKNKAQNDVIAATIIAKGEKFVRVLVPTGAWTGEVSISAPGCGRVSVANFIIGQAP